MCVCVCVCVCVCDTVCTCVGIVPPAASVGVKEPVECDGVAEDDEVFVDCPEAAQEGQMVLQGRLAVTPVPDDTCL